MGESQCTHCGHITTGFEQKEFEIRDKARGALSAISGYTNFNFEDPKSVLRALDHVRALARDAFNAT